MLDLKNDEITIELKGEDEVFDLGTWLGRRQAFGLIASRSSLADIECLAEIREKKLYRALDLTWEQFCVDRLGITREWAERLIRRLKRLGPGYFRLNNFTRIQPADYLRLAGAVTEDGLSFAGEIIPFELERSTDLAHAVEALRQESAPTPEPPTPEQTFARAEKALQAAVAAFERLQSMNLDEDGRLRLVVAAEAGRDHLDRIRLTTPL